MYSCYYFYNYLIVYINKDFIKECNTKNIEYIKTYKVYDLYFYLFEVENNNNNILSIVLPIVFFITLFIGATFGFIKYNLIIKSFFNGIKEKFNNIKWCNPFNKMLKKIKYLYKKPKYEFSDKGTIIEYVNDIEKMNY